MKEINRENTCASLDILTAFYRIYGGHSMSSQIYQHQHRALHSHSFILANQVESNLLFGHESYHTGTPSSQTPRFVGENFIVA